ncbi:MAG: hypothetical protein HKN62_00885 [Phycisphaerales bacterium]|nr:hypothetical protein [Phycisphaerales bacterium]
MLLLLAGCGVSAGHQGRTLVIDSIAAHGGLERWNGSGQLQFRWVYHMTDRGPKAVVDTVQTVSPRTMDVVHEVTGRDVRFGMYRGEAWILPADAEFTPSPRFWAQTPIYFLGIPFVFDDANARFEQLEEDLEFEGKAYRQVKVTFAQDAGDSPDDYYVLLIDPQTKLTRGAYYTVANPLVAPDGPGPPKFITLDDLQDVNGLKLAGSHRTFAMEWHDPLKRVHHCATIPVIGKEFHRGRRIDEQEEEAAYAAADC